MAVVDFLDSRENTGQRIVPLLGADALTNRTVAVGDRRAGRGGCTWVVDPVSGPTGSVGLSSPVFSRGALITGLQEWSLAIGSRRNLHRCGSPNLLAELESIQHVQGGLFKVDESHYIS